MRNEIVEMKKKAQEAKTQYLLSRISRQEALEYMAPYIEEYNRKSAEIAEKYDQKVKKISFNYLIKSRYF